MEDQSPTLSNGVNGKVNGHALTGKSAAHKPEVSENIFLFYPNIIGMWLSLVGILNPQFFLTTSRLFSDHTRHRFSILHAFTSKNMFTPL